MEHVLKKGRYEYRPFLCVKPVMGKTIWLVLKRYQLCERIVIHRGQNYYALTIIEKRGLLGVQGNKSC